MLYIFKRWAVHCWLVRQTQWSLWMYLGSSSLNASSLSLKARTIYSWTKKGRDQWPTLWEKLTQKQIEHTMSFHPSKLAKVKHFTSPNREWEIQFPGNPQAMGTTPTTICHHQLAQNPTWHNSDKRKSSDIYQRSIVRRIIPQQRLNFWQNVPPRIKKINKRK